MQRARLLILPLVLSLFCPACATHASDASAGRATVDLQKIRNSNFQDFVREFWADWGGVGSFYELPWSEVRFDRMESLFNGWQQRLNAVKFESLNQQGRIDYLLVRNKLTHELAALKLARKRLQEMEELLGFRGPIQKLERARWRMEAVDSQAAAAEISVLPDKVKKLRERLEKGKKQKDENKSKASKKESTTALASDITKPEENAETEKSKSSDSAENEKPKKDEIVPLKLSPQLARRTAAAVNEVRGSLKNWFTFYDGYQPDFSWWVKKPYSEAASSLDDFSK